MPPADPYSAIIVKALADRLVDAFAEYLHARARRDWGYGLAEQLSTDELIAEKYRGIRPAFGYPAYPDHHETRRLFDLLGAHRIGMELTESCAMIPAASVSGTHRRGTSSSSELVSTKWKITRDARVSASRKWNDGCGRCWREPSLVGA
jgi:cobalamin-dependent methionine synthase I